MLAIYLFSFFPDIVWSICAFIVWCVWSVVVFVTSVMISILTVIINKTFILIPGPFAKLLCGLWYIITSISNFLCTVITSVCSPVFSICSFIMSYLVIPLFNLSYYIIFYGLIGLIILYHANNVCKNKVDRLFNDLYDEYRNNVGRWFHELSDKFDIIIIKIQETINGPKKIKYNKSNMNRASYYTVSNNKEIISFCLLQTFPSSEINRYVAVPQMVEDRILGDIDRRREINGPYDNTKYWYEGSASSRPTDDDYYYKHSWNMKQSVFLLRMKFDKKYYVGTCVCKGGGEIDYFITCAHNLVNKNKKNDGKLQWADAVWVRINNKLYQVDKMFIYPKYYKKMTPDSGHDFACVHIKEHRNNTPFPQYHIQLQEGFEGIDDRLKKVNNKYKCGIYGYPGDKNGGFWGMEGVMEWEDINYRACSDYTDGVIFIYDIDTKPGNSGSPIFIETRNEWEQRIREIVLVGIHTGSYKHIAKNMGTIITNRKYNWFMDHALDR